MIREFLDYAVSQIPPDKIFIGFSVIGYDWELPYIQGYSRSHALTTDAAIHLAHKTKVPIEYAQTPVSPYFFYKDSNTSFNRTI